LQSKADKNIYQTFFALIWCNESVSRVTFVASLGIFRITSLTVVNLAFCTTHTDIKRTED